MNIKKLIQQKFNDADDKIEYIEDLRDFLYSISPLNTQPVDRVRWVDINKVQANDYNPNSVATIEMKLLHTSIKHDGYTQPVERFTTKL